jgi:malonyl-CoA/methylmalonyl-CoA synthetase
LTFPPICVSSVFHLWPAPRPPHFNSRDDMQYLKRGLEAPLRECVVDAEGSWSYQQLLERTQFVATRLARLVGWSSGDRVGLFLPRQKESAAILLGVFRAGGIATPFSVRGTAREIAHQILDAGTSHVLVEDAFIPLMTDAMALVAQRGITPQWSLARSMLEPISGSPPADPQDDAPALILYTSGTTGLPKGVVHTHASLAAQVEVLYREWEWNAADRLLHVLPLHHIHGLVNGLLGALWGGAQLRLMETFSPADVWNAFAAGSVSVFYAVPTIYHQLADAWERQDQSTRERWSEGARGLRLMVSGSAALPARMWNRWREITGQELLERYGMTEIGMAISNPLRGERRPGTVGMPLPGFRVRIVSDEGTDVASGMPGEIWVQGPALFREYWNQPDATRASLRDGFFRTGDIAEDHNGYICIRGRASVDILKSAGYKLSALEIEDVLREHSAIREVAVVGMPDAEWGEIVTACVIIQPGQSLTLEQLREWCRDKLASYKAPRRLEICQELPRNAMGKVVKTELIRQLMG